MRSRTFVLALLAFTTVASRLDSESMPAVEATIFDIRPGKTAKAEVDLRLGEPLRKLEADAHAHYEYAPPREAPEAERLVVSFFTDNWQVARIDVRLKAPMPADLLRDQFGTRVIARERAVEREELFYPRLQGLLLAGKAADAPAAAISYLSQRWLADYYVDRFNEHLRAGSYDEARFAADKAVIIAPDYARGYVAQGTLFSKLNNHAEARVRFMAGVNAAAGPRARTIARLWLGRWYLEQGNQAREAEAEYRKALEEAPSLAEVHLRYGQFLVNQKRPGDAIAALKQAVELEPKNMEARRSLADVLRDQRRYAEEYPHLQAVFEWAEAGGTADVAVRARILRRYAGALWPGRGQPDRPSFGKPQQALEAYARAAHVDLRDTWALFAMGEIHRESGAPVKAIECYRSGIERNPKSIELQRGLAMALLESGRYDEARQVAEASVQLNPELAAAQMVQVARAWSALRDKKRTLVWLNKAAAAGYKDRQYLSSDPFFASVRNNGDFKKILERMQ